MDVELIEIRDFLAAHPPFDRLPADALERLPRTLAVRYLRRGSVFPPRDSGGPFLHILRTGAVELRGPGNLLLDQLSEGDCYAEACGNGEAESPVDATAVEDSLLSLLPCTELAALRRHHPGFDEHFGASTRLRQALGRLQEGQRGISPMTLKRGSWSAERRSPSILRPPSARPPNA